MSRRRNQQHLDVGEDTRIAVNLTIKKLLESADQNELEFPSCYIAEERAYIHNLAHQLGLKSKSKGRGANRYVIVYKRDGSTIVQADAVIKLQKLSRQSIYNLIKQFPLDSKERRDLLPPSEKEKVLDTEVTTNIKAMGRLNNSIPQVPQLKTNYELLNFRNSLTIMTTRDEILRMLANNQVAIVLGETGCGKTTQVPQFILEDCQQKHKPCRIICTEPRRLSAVTVAERVAFERDEKIGQTFGYQIRLESRVAPKTLLTYCTNGVLLRTLMGDDSALAMITHIIVDEVHERDRFCDFLLIVLKDALTKYKSLKVILMSAMIDPSIFIRYFDNCPVIYIPEKLYNVDVYYLEDILKITNYMTKEMLCKKKEVLNRKDQCKVLKSWNQCKYQSYESLRKKEKNPIPIPILKQQNEPIAEKVELEPWLIEEMDKSIATAWLLGGEDSLTQILHLIHSENISVDYQHSKTFVSTLMVAAGRGYLNIVEQLLDLGANLNLKACNEWTAYEWAKNMKQHECAEFIEAYAKTCNYIWKDNEIVKVKSSNISESDRLTLDIYESTFNNDNVDYTLILTLIVHIHLNMPAGSILVFLPGYDDIVTMRERINSENKMNQGNYILYILHSNMQTNDQKRVFKPSPQGTRKIILSTNIAESSITIDDVVYVVDSGKVKEKSFVGLSEVSMLRSNWISQSCAQQRKGRAGRCQKGICYRLYSSIRYSNLQLYRTPEILRLPLQQLCLYTKHLAPGNTPIGEFLAKAIEPPSTVVISNAVQLLKTIDALDPWEDLTELGSHLLDLPIEPRLGKMLLYAVVLKCLDPILTIVCSLAYKDPFVTPYQPSKKQSAKLARKEFAANTYSDHMAVLRAFQIWQNARANGWERSFCEKNFISAAVMEMVVGMRTQLLGQLRASGFVKTRGSGDIRDLNSNSENWAVVKAALTAGLYPNLIRVDREYVQLRTQKEVNVFFHPSSTLRDISKSSRTTTSQVHALNVSSLPTDWMLYEEVSRSGRFSHARTVTLVNPLTVVLFSGPARLPMDVIYEAESTPESESDSEVEESREGTTILKLDQWISFKVDTEAAQLILHLRQKWNALFLRRMTNPSKIMSQQDEQVLKTLITVITNEEQACGLHQPLGIGQRPRPLLVDYYPASAKRTDDVEDKNL
ncbi:3'-5' RNA helicase YTHDC2-like [Phymastichus coffea]|uniref:3'-5' RNA helicase YTHDC2-like n=1 Tax=Phymastichus coffea TaxID=108790 RepID=UPI00273BBCEF|nr:3'-5' RNA helicase YTHDC2-like [Phymastichus coffea]